MKGSVCKFQAIKSIGKGPEIRKSSSHWKNLKKIDTPGTEESRLENLSSVYFSY